MENTPTLSVSTVESSSSNDTDLGNILGEAFWLIGRTAPLRDRAIGEMYDVVAASVQARTFRLFRQEKAPLAFAIWGFLGEPEEQKLRDGKTLNAQELRSGEKLWLLLVASPFVPADVIIKELKETEFIGQPILTLL